MTGQAPDSPLDPAAAYALGALSADDAQQFEALLAGSPEARREVDEYREVAALLGLADAPAAPAALRERVLAQVGERKSRVLPGSGVASATRGPWLALAASLVLAAGLGTALVSARGRLGAVETELAARERTLAQTKGRLSEREATLNSILEPGVRLFQLTASGDPDPAIQLFWNRERNRAIVHGVKLKPVPKGRAYQLWFIRDGKPVPSVTFRPEADGHAKVEHIRVPEGGSLSAAAVTVEPLGGSPQPTSPIVLVGTLQKS